MRLRSRDLFDTVHTEGGLLPGELLQGVADADTSIGGISPADYHLPPSERLNEAITRSWSRLLGAWRAFDEARGQLPPGDRGGRVTRERWLNVLFHELDYGRLVQQPAVEIDGKPFPLFTQWGTHVPIHLVGCNVRLDARTPGVAGAAGQSPHSLVQEVLNRSTNHLWGIVSNGLVLRLLRDNVALTRQAYVEFDLEAIFNGEAYSDFVVLWLVTHQSRVEGEPRECWLERWTQTAVSQGTRALDSLREGVEEAITILGSGFLAHPANTALQTALRDGSLDSREYYRRLLRLVYRFLFLFVAEDRDALLDPLADRTAKERYAAHYSTQQLRSLAQRRRGGRQHDRYEQLKVVMTVLHEDGSSPLALPALGSFLWSAEAIGELASANLANEYLLGAVRALTTVEEGGVRRSVDFRNLGAEELGSIYESLLELEPDLHRESATFALGTAAGSERKTTGSYYTPTSLITLLLDSALEPLIDDRLSGTDDPEMTLLELTVCDPACGSGHFLIAAANRIAKRLAAIRTGDAEPAPPDMRNALRDVIASCIYGVDANPMAVELCKVSLWMEALVPGRPLSFLDAHIRVGDSLVGTGLTLVEEGVPDDAYKPLLGDERDVVKSTKAQNAAERAGQLTTEEAVRDLAVQLAQQSAAAESNVVDTSLEEVRERERQHREVEASPAALHLHGAADAWTAAFLAPRTRSTPRFTTGLVRVAAGGKGEALDAARQAVADFRPFHWELEFPAVFANTGGFDAVIGNPPWGRVKLQEKRFFSASAPEIAAAKNKAAREKQILALDNSDPDLLRRYHAELRRFEALSLFFHNSGRFPLTGVGDVNTYALFAELARSLLASGGRAGLVLQSGIVTDDTTKAFFADLVDSQSLVSVYGFENEEKLFPAVHNQTKFCILSVASPGAGPTEFDLSFFNRQPDTVRDADRLFRLTAADVEAINPNTRTCPVFRSSRDAEILRLLHRRFPILFSDGPPARNPWGVTFQRMFDMANDSGLFRSAEELQLDGWLRDGEIFVRGDQRCIPLLEGKMTWLWNPRFGTYEGQTEAQANKGVLPPSSEEQLADATYVNRPRYWVEEWRVEQEWKGEHEWALAWRDVGPSERTFIASAVPRWAAGDKLPLAHVAHENRDRALCLLAAMSGLVADFALRARSATGSMKYFIVKHLPVPTPEEFLGPCPWDPSTSIGEWVSSRALELIYTADVLGPLARDVGSDAPPFHWDTKRRRRLQAELDAGFFRLATLSREHTEHVLDSFRVLRQVEERAHGEFLTRRLVLECYDALE